MQFEWNEIRAKQKRVVMNRRRLLLATLASGLALGGQSENSDLTVEVNYAGSGTVDSSHKVYVALWDSPDFTRDGSQLQPIKGDSISTRSGTVHFNGVRSNPVYVSAVYDPTGQWNGKSALPPEAARGAYGKKRHTPEPIQLSPGKTVTISFSFPRPMEG